MKIISSKKGFLKTIEVFLAITIVFVFILMTQNKNIAASEQENKNVLTFLSSDESFRSNIYSINNYCVNKGSRLAINDRIESILPKYLNYTMCVYDDPNFRITSLPDKKIYVETYYFASDGFLFKTRIAKLFYWS
jgi:hypothetical protein